MEVVVVLVREAGEKQKTEREWKEQESRGIAMREREKERFSNIKTFT